MNPVTVAIGAMAIAYGVFNAVARVRWPHMFDKLQPMRERWGDRAGMAVHVVGYTIVPIAFGVVMALAGVAGADPF